MGSMSMAYDGSDVRHQIEVQKKTAAVETLFTMSLLTFSYLQIAGIKPLLEGIASVESATVIASSILYFGTMWIAAILGGDNLVEVFKKESSYFEEESWEHLG